MNITRRLRRLTTLVVLVALIAAPLAAEAQQFVCRPIARGDTASGLARRLTGNAATAYTERFQIRDPARGRFVPKSQYKRLRAHWDVCIASDVRISRVAAPATQAPRAPQPSPPQRLQLMLPRAPQPSASPYDASLGWRVGVMVSLMLFACSVIRKRVTARRTIPPEMQRAGEQFLSAFTRPLVDPASDVAPIKARFRFVPELHQLEIFIAPNAGRRYPNLFDHKRNVEYDVDRVVQLLGRDVVVSDRLRAEGPWVVVPIRRVDLKQAGAK